MKLSFNANNQVDMPELVLGRRNYDKFGSIVNVTDFIYEYQLMSADSISFTVHKKIGDEPCRLWDEIRDRRLVWVKEFNEWFEISVSTEEKGSTVKNITGTSLCEAELSQILTGNIEINTENDIARDDYEITRFYNPDIAKASLLHRITKAVPNYKIGHVDKSLWNIQRTFSISNSTYLYNFLTGELAKEIGCIFIFDSAARIINVYDLQSFCLDCRHRRDFDGSCPECGSANIQHGYGEDTTIYIDNENLAESISLQPKSEEVKNCFKIIGGDDLITATIAAVSPNGSNEIYLWSDEDRADMSEALKEKLVKYEQLYGSKSDEAEALNRDYYNLVDEKLCLESSMMPDIDTNPSTTASMELSKLTQSSLSPVAVSDINTVSKATSSNAVLSMAKCLINSSVYKISIIDKSDSLSGRTWRGRFRVENYSDGNDYAESFDAVTVTINDSKDTSIRQEIEKAINRDDAYLIDLFNKDTSLSEFKAELKKYCLARLTAFSSAYRDVIDILTKADCGNEKLHGDLYNDLYVPYYNKWSAIDSEIKVREAEIRNVERRQSEIRGQLAEISGLLDMEKYFGKELYNELCSLRREDIYENSNYISDGLDNAQIFDKAKELRKTAIAEISKASGTQWTLSASIYNLLAIPEFQPLISKFEGGNWLRIKIDDKIFRLRLVRFKLDYNNLSSLDAEFSDVTDGLNCVGDLQSLYNKTNSMAGSFSYVARQAKQGEKSFKKVNGLLEDGLSTALFNIKSGANQNFLIDKHGILGRQWVDELDDYGPTQSRWINNLLVFTKDYWKHTETALGEIQFTHPLTGLKVKDYGLLAKYVAAGMLVGNDMIGGNIYSSNYKNNGSSVTGAHFDLENGSFSFADGKLSYENNTLAVKGTVYASDGEFSGRITAKTGQIGGFYISSSSDHSPYTGHCYSNSLYRHSGDGSYEYEVGIKGDGASASADSPGSGSSNLAFYVKRILKGASWDSAENLFYVNHSGRLFCSNAEITGKITADNGKIGGFAISGTSLSSYSGDSLSRIVIGSYDYDTSNRNAIIIQNRDKTTDPFVSHFRVRYDGSVYADKVDLSGKITAESGQVGGWTITSGKIFGGDKETGVAVIQKPSASTTWVFAAGGSSHDNYTDCPFRVSKSGKLYANDSEITGKITAESGKIGGWTISATDLYVTDRSGMSSDFSKYAFWAGETNSANGAANTNAPFRVGHDGFVYVSGGNIGGCLIKNGVLQIDGGNITAGKITADRLDIDGLLKSTNFQSSQILTHGLYIITDTDNPDSHGGITTPYLNGKGLAWKDISINGETVTVLAGK